MIINKNYLSKLISKYFPILIGYWNESNKNNAISFRTSLSQAQDFFYGHKLLFLRNKVTKTINFINYRNILYKKQTKPVFKFFQICSDIYKTKFKKNLLF